MYGVVLALAISQLVQVHVSWRKRPSFNHQNLFGVVLLVAQPATSSPPASQSAHTHTLFTLKYANLSFDPFFSVLKKTSVPTTNNTPTTHESAHILVAFILHSPGTRSHVPWHHNDAAAAAAATAQYAEKNAREIELFIFFSNVSMASIKATRDVSRRVECVPLNSSLR